jgi:thiamine-monophosphate kinase
VGDDCAVLPELAGSNLVLSTDVSVEEVHFRLDWLRPSEIGWRAAAAALSDLAAAGAAAVGLLAAVTVPRDTSEKTLTELMQGVGGAVASVGGVVLGGDLSSGNVWSLAITVLGRAARPLSRRGADPGDGVWVTGRLGGARAALESWRRGVEPDPEARTAFARPEPRLAAGRSLAARGATALIDLSDGLASDAAHVAAASAVELRIELDRLPVAASAERFAQSAGISPAEFAARGGEDYELLTTLPASFDATAAHAFYEETGLPLTQIGRVMSGSGARLMLRGAEVPLTGFDHFR